jgi:hypothetical protein
MSIPKQPVHPILELPKTPRIGERIELPIGLRYTNEYYASAHVTKRVHQVVVVDVDRDEVYWRISNEEKCYARFRRKTAAA